MANDPRRGGVPHGHPTLNNFLGLPVVFNGELLAMVGLANRPGGYDLDLVSQLQPLLHTLGQLVVAHRTDVALAIERANRLAQSELLASVFSHAREGICIASLDGRLLQVNSAFERLLQVDSSDALGRRLWFLRSDSGRRGITAAIWQALREQGFWEGDYEIRTSPHCALNVMLTIARVDGQGEEAHLLIIFHDISQQKRQQRQLLQIAHYDALTGLPNRILFSEKVEWLKQSGFDFMFGVVFIDLDGFKAINDQYGHKIGDALLKKVAMRLTRAMRADDLLSRFGGDEFVGLIQQVPDDLLALEQLMSRLLHAAAKPIYLDGLKMQVSCSIGVTLAHTQDFESVDLLLRQADYAMYQAKIEGKNRFHVFDPAREAWQKDRHSHFKRMRQAMDLNELRVFYLPIVSLRTGEFKGAEALIRWQHPEKGLLSPDQFMPMLTDHMLEVELGWWVIDQVVRDSLVWREQQFECRINLNISAQQMQQLDFNDRLIAKLESIEEGHDIALELEILESSVFESLPNLSEKINQLKSYDIRLAVDDFGTGYSSFDYLKKLSLDTLKIDRSFVMNMLEDSEDQAILASMIALGHAFNLDVVAEGVESIAHGKRLRAMGCDYAQGYGIAKPMPADDLVVWARSWSNQVFGIID